MTIVFNAPQVLAITSDLIESGQVSDSYMVNSIGTGSFTGLSYTVPAFTTGTLKADIQVMSLTSQDIANLNTLITGFLSASERSKIENTIQAKASADLGFLDFFTGGVSASYDQTYSSMQSSGLTDDQITEIIESFAAAATSMSHVSLDFTIDNSTNDFAVSGDLELYTIAGQIQTSKGTTQFRTLANQGSAGNGAAPASGNVIPLN